MLKGMRAYMVGWVLVMWFFTVPLLGDPVNVAISHVIGSGIVVCYMLIRGILKSEKETSNEDKSLEPEEPQTPNPGFVVLYSLTVAIAMVLSIYLGTQWLDTDPTFIANSTFMIIGLNTKQTWKFGLERMLGALLGILIGFYMGMVLQYGVLGFIFCMVMAFFTLSVLEVNTGLTVFFLLALIAYGCGIIEYDKGNHIANERLFAEFTGFLIAGLAITILNALRKYFNKNFTSIIK